MEHIFLDFLLSFSESHSSTSSSCHLVISLMNSTPDLSFEFQTQLFEKYEEPKEHVEVDVLSVFVLPLFSQYYITSKKTK